LDYMGRLFCHQCGAQCEFPSDLGMGFPEPPRDFICLTCKSSAVDVYTLLLNLGVFGDTAQLCKCGTGLPVWDRGSRFCFHCGVRFRNEVSQIVEDTLITLETNQNEEDSKWLCPWCQTMASLETPYLVICDSKTCRCGAIALGAPPFDFDEIIDDAINIFGVQTRLESRGFDDLLLKDLKMNGVEVKEGALTEDARSTFKYQYMWFRKQTTQ
jgi:hypothetical protein